MSTSADTIAFAEKIFAVLNEGAKSATYKYAVLMGLLDLCCEYHDDNGFPPQAVTTEQLARKVLELYWPQSIPFGDTGQPLCQFNDRTKQARTISLIHSYRAKYVEAESPYRFERLNRPAFEALLREIEQKMVEDPLPRLQKVRGLGEENFIYRIWWTNGVSPGRFRAGSNQIHFVDDAQHHLVRLRGLLRPMLQQEWTRWVSANNGIRDELGKYLFPENREALGDLRDPLLDLQSNLCFYCEKSIRGQADVDHFLPWARTHNDTLGNLVAAHPKCNSYKSANYAAICHLENWVDRLDNHRTVLEQIADQKDWPFDSRASLGLARGIYLNLPKGVRLWVAEKKFEELGRERIREALHLI